MYDLSPFDSRWLKIANWLGRHWYLPLAAALLVLLPTSVARLPPFLFPPLFLLTIYLGLCADTLLPGNAFGYKNGAENFFLKHDRDVTFLYEQYRSMQGSTFIRHERFVWSVMVDDTEVALMFTDDGGCVAWLQLERVFPHIVVDSLGDHHSLHQLWVKNPLPTERIQLEGDFPDYFHVYQEPGQQVTTLQILAPDRMQYMVDNLKQINLEIQDKYLRLYAAHAQRTSVDFQAFLNTLASFQKGLQVQAINTIR